MARHDRIAALSVVAAALGAGWLMHAVPASASGPSAPATRQADQKIATLNAFLVVEKMVQSDRYKPSRETQMKEYQGNMETVKGELELLVKDIVAAGQDSEKGKALIQQYQVRKREADQLEQELQLKAAEFNTQQLAEAYRLVIETANQLADKGGYTHVIATRGIASEPLRSNNVAAAVQEILARPVVRFPAGDDLTDAVAKELKVDTVVTEGDPAAAPAVQTPAPEATPPK